MKNQEIEWLLKYKYGGKKTEAFFSDCKRLSLGEPLDYLIGWSEFLGCKIWLDNQPLIPRTETEFWTEEAIRTIRQSQTLSLGLTDETPKVLDLCAGSGCIGVAVLTQVPHARVDFGELDANLLPTITKNIDENIEAKERTRVIHTNLFSHLPDTYDFILSNPPYINQALNRVQSEVREYEPYVALFGGEDGLEIITDLIKSAPAHLKPGGQLWLEHEPEQSSKITELAHQAHFSITTHPDQFGKQRYSILVLQ